MISIITAIYNQIGLNRLFYKNLVNYTHGPFELIIIDNNSNDGSREFFKSVGAVVIENDGNYSYPYCQNQGINIARGEILAFLNNDIIVAPNWDLNLLDTMKHHQLDIITCCGIEQAENPVTTKKFRKRWHKIKYGIGVIARNELSFSIMHRLMYGNWEKFSDQRQKKFGRDVIEGFVGNTVVMSRKAIELLGLWDEKIQAGDFDLFMRSKKRSLEKGDIKPMHISLGVFNHHFIRITAKSKPPVFKDSANLITFDEKWSEKERTLYLQQIIL
ncbi:MAG: glycosyltransferase family 2 protein [Bacteroidetes bacterium]|nr:glycosyltransferase family 2 protein [Bacteroidota bacterium]